MKNIFAAAAIFFAFSSAAFADIQCTPYDSRPGFPSELVIAKSASGHYSINGVAVSPVVPAGAWVRFTSSYKFIIAPNFDGLAVGHLTNVKANMDEMYECAGNL